MRDSEEQSADAGYGLMECVRSRNYILRPMWTTSVLGLGQSILMTTTFSHMLRNGPTSLATLESDLTDAATLRISLVWKSVASTMVTYIPSTMELLGNFV